jgi:hypothetical protein
MPEVSVVCRFGVENQEAAKAEFCFKFQCFIHQPFDIGLLCLEALKFML